MYRFSKVECEKTNMKKFIAGEFAFIKAFHITKYEPSKASHSPIESNKFVSSTHSFVMGRYEYEEL